MDSLTMIDLTKMKCNDWYIDSSATQDTTNRRDWFIEYKSFLSPKSMYSANNSIRLQAMGSGRLVVHTYNIHTWIEWSFLDIWFCPDGALNLYYVKKAGQKGIDQDI